MSKSLKEMRKEVKAMRAFFCKPYSKMSKADLQKELDHHDKMMKYQEMRESDSSSDEEKPKVKAESKKRTPVSDEVKAKRMAALVKARAAKAAKKPEAKKPEAKLAPIAPVLSQMTEEVPARKSVVEKIPARKGRVENRVAEIETIATRKQAVKRKAVDKPKNEL